MRNNQRFGFILDSLLCLTYGLEEGARGVFDVPELGYGELGRLYEGIADCLENYGFVVRITGSPSTALEIKITAVEVYTAY